MFLGFSFTIHRSVKFKKSSEMKSCHFAQFVAVLHKLPKDWLIFIILTFSS
uniref:Uncharacterized protein n=1 Tax=Arion vulgaris TaxID=1028688 RepID=A0A0B7AHM0_9EUPU